MKAFRISLAVVTVASVLSAGLASAAAPVSCKLVVDKAGDASLTTATPVGPSEGALDITYVDLATDKTKMTGVFGLTKAAADAATAPNGYRQLLFFTAPGFADPVFLSASSAARTGVTFSFGADQVDGLATLGAASGVLDTKKNEIRITAKLSDLKAGGINLKPGMVLTAISGVTSRDFTAAFLYADRANTDPKDYTVGAKSCVAVGK